MTEKKYKIIESFDDSFAFTTSGEFHLLKKFVRGRQKWVGTSIPTLFEGTYEIGEANQI